MTDAAGAHVSERWARWRSAVDLGEYHTRWDHLERSGLAPHGEADLIASLGPSSVLDAGCGMGRVAIELARRGIDVVGADLDAELLAYARRDAPHITWLHADLATLDLGRTFDAVAMPGNVMIFCRPEDRAPIVSSAAAHLHPGAALVAGFALESHAGALDLEEYDALCAAAGLALDERYSTWERGPFSGGDYVVSIHRRR